MSVKAIKVPTTGESVTEVVVASWMKEDGDYVEMDEILCELESDKATLELPAETAGKLKIKVEAGETVEPGDVICEIDESAEAPADKTSEETRSGADQEKAAPPQAEAAPESKPAAKTEPQKETYATGHASPAAAKLMREHDIKAEAIKGSGKDGRITKEDVQQALKEGNGRQTAANAEPATGNFSREETRKKMSPLRKSVSRHLVAAKNETAMLTTFNEVDMTAVMAARHKYKKAFEEKHGVRLGFMSFFIKAVCHALRDFPAVNAKMDGEEVLYHDYCDISIAVSTPKGLVVPFIKNAESLSMAQLEAKVYDLAVRGRDNKLTMEEMQGGTFTISNGGVFGSLLSTPIINPPQSGILGMHKIEERPVAANGKVEVRPMMYVALSYDHRVIDGKESVSFLVRVKEQLEAPEALLLGKNPVETLLELL